MIIVRLETGFVDLAKVDYVTFVGPVEKSRDSIRLYFQGGTTFKLTGEDAKRVLAWYDNHAQGTVTKEL